MKKTFVQIGKWTLTIVIVAVSLYFSLKNIDFKGFLGEIQKANLWIAITPIPIMLLSHWIRALRWRTILRPIMGPKKMSNLFSAIMVGYFFNNVMPRGGEFMRPFIYAKREKQSFSTVFSTIVIERFIDVLTLLFLLVIALIVSKNKILNAFPENANWSIMLYIIIIGLVMVFLVLYPPVMNKLLEKLVRPISHSLYTKLHDLFHKFKVGFEIIKKPSQYFQLSLESLAIWACYAIPMYIHFYCFDFSSSISLGLSDALFLLVVSGIGVSIAPTPGGVGVFHFVVSYAIIKLYGLSNEQAMAYATVNHFINFALQVSVGLACFLRERIKKIPSAEGDNVELNFSNAK